MRRIIVGFDGSPFATAALVRPDAMHETDGRVVVGVDGSPTDDQLVRWGTDLVQGQLASVEVEARPSSSTDTPVTSW